MIYLDDQDEHEPLKSAPCDCSSSSRCAEADRLWASANAVYYSQGYDAWIEALGPYREHMSRVTS